MKPTNPFGYNPNIIYSSLTIKLKRIPNVLIVPVELSLDANSSECRRFKASAVWDTGATCSVISSKVAAEMGLSPISYNKVCGVHGSKDAPVYFLDIILNRSICFKRKITGGDLGDGQIDFLIGMDIIGLGESCITHGKDENGDNCFVFSFLYPPTGKIRDFAAELRNLETQHRKNQINNKARREYESKKRQSKKKKR